MFVWMFLEETGSSSVCWVDDRFNRAETKFSNFNKEFFSNLHRIFGLGIILHHFSFAQRWNQMPLRTCTRRDPVIHPKLQQFLYPWSIFLNKFFRVLFKKSKGLISVIPTEKCSGMGTQSVGGAGTRFCSWWCWWDCWYGWWWRRQRLNRHITSRTCIVWRFYRGRCWGSGL